LASPFVDFVLTLLNASFSFLPFSWLPLVLFSLSISHGKICNDQLLQLIDCIELMKNEVKKKMNAMNECCCTKVTERRAMKKKILASVNEKTWRACDREQFRVAANPLGLCLAIELAKQATRSALDGSSSISRVAASIMRT
jgi:hypothetical protein